MIQFGSTKWQAAGLWCVLIIFSISGTVSAAEDFKSPEPANSPENSRVTFFKASAPSYAYGDPSVAEQVMLEKINQARLYPEETAAGYGIDLNEGLEPGDISASPVQPLTFNALLSDAAGSHSVDMMENNYISHTARSGETPFERMENAGFSYSCASENIAWIGSMAALPEIETTIQLHENLFIDGDVPSRGHRLNILNPDFKEIGIGVCSGPFTLQEPDTVFWPNSMLVTCDFASSDTYSEAFILGVVFDDLDQDGAYSAGEGKAGIVITVDQDGSPVTDTLTATAGGYALPLPPGTYVVSALVSDSRTVEKIVSLTGSNVKVDFITGDEKPGGDGTTPPEDGGTAPGADGGGGGGGCFITTLLAP